MKRILCLILAVACILTSFCSCSSLNEQPITLADTISIPEDGIIEAYVFDTLKSENKAVTFVGDSNGLRYEWIVFGGDIKEPKALNLGIEITSANDKRVEFRFLSEENFDFSPTLSIYLNTVWDAEGASLSALNSPDTTAKQNVSITSLDKSILNFTPKIQKGDFVIVPNAKLDTESSSAVSEPASDISDKTDKSEQSVTHTTKPAVSESTTNSKKTNSDGKVTTTDKYKTDPVPEGKPLPVEPDTQKVDERKTYTCTFSIECTSIFNNLDKLNPEKLDVLPKNGVIFPSQTVTFYEGESVYDVLLRVCKENKIHMEASFTPMYNSAYVEGLGNLYEFDCGSGSGWMYRVDGWYPNYGCSRYQLKQGETVEWRYTCDLGKDIGGGYAVGT